MGGMVGDSLSQLNKPSLSVLVLLDASFDSDGAQVVTGFDLHVTATRCVPMPTAPARPAPRPRMRKLFIYF